jgi:hypothetical protein
MEVCPTDVILAPAERVWRLQMVFGRRFVTGPADALGRLKRAAEQQDGPL